MILFLWLGTRVHPLTNTHKDGGMEEEKGGIIDLLTDAHHSATTKCMNSKFQPNGCHGYCALLRTIPPLISGQ